MELTDSGVLDAAPSFSRATAALSVVSPEGPAAVRDAIAPAPGLDDLQGRTLAFVSNTKPNIDLLLKSYASLLHDRHAVSALYDRKRNAAVGAGPLIGQLAARSDGVVTGIADCGACTAQSARDTVAFEREGVPTVLVTTTAFEELARYQTHHSGADRVRMLVLPHPFDTLSPDEVVAVAERTVDDVVALLKSGAGRETAAPAESA